MASLQKLKIENFRGFDSIEIDGFSKINLLVGKNNSGKTSVLEAIFLVAGMSDPNLIALNSIRDSDLHNTLLPEHLRYFFHNANDEKKPHFIAKMNDSSERELAFEAIKKQNVNSFSSVIESEFVGINLHFRENQDTPIMTNSLTFDNHWVKQISKDYSEKLYAMFVVEKDDYATLMRFSNIVKRREDDIVLNVLRSFDSRIKGVKALPYAIYCDMDGIEELVPIRIMGDGIRRFLSIITAVADKKEAIILIDEIENGLHHSAHKLLWKSLLSFVKLNDVQLFITTHNIETLSSLKSVLEEDQFESMRDFAKVFTITKTLKAGYKAHGYSFEGFKGAIDRENEIRN